MSKILITDDLFILPRHEEMLREAGFGNLVRIGGAASEDELCDAICGAEGYIIGGIETVTARVIAAGAPSLRAIAFTGTGYREFIPGHEEATRRGIKITNAPGANAAAVAEFTLALILPMVRRIPEISGDVGIKTFEAPDFEDTTIAVIGYGEIGRRVAAMLKGLGFQVIVTGRGGRAQQDGFEQVTITEATSRADVVTIHVSKEHGENVLDASVINELKAGAIVVNAAFPEAVDQEALAERIRSGELRAAFDKAMTLKDKSFEPGRYIESKLQSGFYTRRAIEKTSAMATRSLLNVLTTGSDEHVVN